jgi:hypothetical protein
MTIIYKEGKINYLIPGSYWPITLKNTLNKKLKRVIADYIIDIVKEYNNNNNYYLINVW